MISSLKYKCPPPPGGYVDVRLRTVAIFAHQVLRRPLFFEKVV